MRLLHPADAHGKASVMIFDGAERPRTWTFGLANLPAALAPWLETSSYLALEIISWATKNRPSRSPRRAVWGPRFLPRQKWSRRGPNALVSAGDIPRRPEHSDAVHRHRYRPRTCRRAASPGTAAGALPIGERRKSPDRALRFVGADRACHDPTGVFRLPGTLNLKSGRCVNVIAGSCARYD